MTLLKPQRLSLYRLIPTEFWIPDDRWKEIARHYTGNPRSIAPISVYHIDRKFIIENGNKRSAFLAAQKCDYIQGYVREHDEEEVRALLQLAGNASQHDVRRVADLCGRILPRTQYEQAMANAPGLAPGSI